MPLTLLKNLKLKTTFKSPKKLDTIPKPIDHHPTSCPECGGWIEFKKTKFGKFYVCRYCKWSCTGEQL